MLPLSFLHALLHRELIGLAPFLHAPDSQASAVAKQLRAVRTYREEIVFHVIEQLTALMGLESAYLSPAPEHSEIAIA